MQYSTNRLIGCGRPKVIWIWEKGKCAFFAKRKPSICVVMTTYISLLRGINVSGQKLIKMGDLKSMCESLGFEQVITYIQSGNVIFTGKPLLTEQVADLMSGQISKQFGFDVPVISLTIEALQAVLRNNPFVCDSAKQSAFMHVTFLKSAPADFDLSEIQGKRLPEEEIVISEKAVYLYCPGGYGKTKLTNTFLEAKLKVAATTRSWKTVQELEQLALYV